MNNSGCQLDDLYNHICAKSPHGIPRPEAEKLMLTLYCTLAILPKEFQALPLSKTNLATLFSKLAGIGKIIPNEGEANLPPELMEGGYWEDLAEQLFRGKIAPDYSFLERASTYV